VGTPLELLHEANAYRSRQRLVLAQRGKPGTLAPSPQPLGDLAQALNLDQDVWSRPWAELSGGERHRAALGVFLALTPSPSIFLLDEPTAACDKQTAERVESLLLGFSKTLIWITHDERQAARIADRILSVSSPAMSVETP